MAAPASSPCQSPVAQCDDRHCELLSSTRRETAAHLPRRKLERAVPIYTEDGKYPSLIAGRKGEGRCHRADPCVRKSASSSSLRVSFSLPTASLAPSSPCEWQSRTSTRLAWC